MRFSNKILLAIWGVVLSLLVITFFIINYWMRSRIEENFALELRSNHSTLSVFMGLQSEILLRGCQVIAESPRLRAVTELRDPGTASQLSQELIQTTLSDLFVLTDLRGQPLVQALHGNEEDLDVARRGSIQQALNRSPAADLWPLKGSIYRVATTPIMVERDLIGTLTIGFDIAKTEAATLKQATNSDIVLMQNDRVVLSTLSREEQDRFQLAFRASPPTSTIDTVDTTAVFTLPVGEEVYLGVMFRMDHSPANTPITLSYAIVKPFERELSNSMAPILGTFGVVSVLFLILTSVIGRVISQGITRPINELVRGTGEVSKGNYDYTIVAEGNDELGFLARKFGEMSKSLKEKITELDRLNKDLLLRNRDLDETLQKLKEAQEELVKGERLAATGKLTAQLAHEINNPIHNIQSCLKTTLGKLPEGFEGRELVEVAFDEVTRMSKLTRQMLDFYRTSLVPEVLRPTNVNDALKDVLTASRAELMAAGITVETTFDPGLPEVNGSNDKLKQVFLNMILNARDAMPHGGMLRISTMTEGNAVKIVLADNGIGIPRENLSRIFDAFFTTKGKVSGVGLGLSVSYGIVHQHRGIITVSSSVGEGTTFVVSLPLLAAHVPMIVTEGQPGERNYSHS